MPAGELSGITGRLDKAMQDWTRQDKDAYDRWLTTEPDYPDLDDLADEDPYTGTRGPDEDACVDGCHHGTSDDDPPEYGSLDEEDAQLVFHRDLPNGDYEAQFRVHFSRGPEPDVPEW